LIKIFITWAPFYIVYCGLALKKKMSLQKEQRMNRLLLHEWFGLRITNRQHRENKRRVTMMETAVDQMQRMMVG